MDVGLCLFPSKPSDNLTGHSQNITSKTSLKQKRITLRKKIIDAFLSISNKTPSGKEILALQRATGFIETNQENYVGLEKAAKSANLLK